MAVKAEQEAIHRALAGRNGEVEFVSHTDVTPEQFTAAMRSPTDVLHISAHAENGRIYLQGVGYTSIGHAELAELIRLMAKESRAPRLVILNACNTEDGLELLLPHVDYAIGIRGEIQETSACLFTSTFYTCLGRGQSIADAFAVAMLRLQMHEETCSGVPRLRWRDGFAPSETILLPVRRAAGRGSRVLGNRYEVPPKALASGELAAVYEALDLWSDPPDRVALKLLHAHHVTNQAIESRFIRGAEVMRRLHHDNIVRVQDVGPREGADRYYVMELLERPESLMVHAADRQLDAAGVVRLGTFLCSALEHAHDQTCIHRDVRPENVLVDAKGCPRLIHFDKVRTPNSGATFGPLVYPEYAAPEVIRSASAAGPASDQYSLAMTLAATILDRAPAPKENVDVFVAAVPTPFRGVLRKALSELPDQRFGTMRAFRVALAGTLREAAPSPPPTPRPLAIPPPSASASAVVPSLSGPMSASAVIAPTRASLLPYAVLGGILGAALLLVGIFMGDSPAAADARAAKGQPAGRAPTTETRADARVEAALRVDHSRAIYAIRIAAETSLESARQHIHAIVQAGGFQPWIAYNRARNRYYVFVGDYANEAAANAASTIVRTLPNEKVWVRAVREDCPYARLHADGYHTCEL
jgi:hypothetical protein